MSECATHTHVAEVIRNELLPGKAGEPSQRVLALWAPLALQRFEVRLFAVPLPGTDAALEDTFPLGSKVLLTESQDRLIQLKPLVSSHHQPQ